MMDDLLIGSITQQRNVLRSTVILLRRLIDHFTQPPGDRKEVRHARVIIGISLADKSRNQENKADRLIQFMLEINATVPLHALGID